MERALPPPADDESALIAGAKRNPHAFEALYERHVHRIFQYSLYRTGNAGDAEEVTAQTFVRALEYLDRYQWRGAPFVVWLYRIADSVIHKSLRRARLRQLPPALPGPPPGLDLEERELRADLLRELYRLPEDQQQVLVLRFVQGLSYDEIAAVVSRTPGALRQLVYRALQTLRERMGTP